MWHCEVASKPVRQRLFDGLLVASIDRGATLPLFEEERRRLNEETRAALAKASGLLPVPGAEIDALEAACIVLGRGERLCAVSQGQLVVAVEQAVDLRAWIEAAHAISATPPTLPSPPASPPPSGPCRDRAVLRTRPPYDAVAIESFGDWRSGCEPVRDALEPVRSAFVACDDGGVVLIAVSTEGAVDRCETRPNLPHAPPPCLCEAARTVRFPRALGPRRAILVQVGFIGQ